MVHLKNLSRPPVSFGRYLVVKCVMYIKARNITPYFWIRVRGTVEGKVTHLDHMIQVHDEGLWDQHLAEAKAKVAEYRYLFDGDNHRMFKESEYLRLADLAVTRENARRALVESIQMSARADVQAVWNRIGPPQPYYPYSMGVQIL